jgi:dihydroorotase
MRVLIQGGHIVNEGRVFNGSIVVEDGKIVDVRSKKDEGRSDASAVNDQSSAFDKIIDATGCYVLPGVIDSHVHFREPGLTDKADIDTESRAAAAGGVTTFFDMPNTQPQTTTLEALQQKFDIARQKSHVNYSFFYGATNDNADSFQQLDGSRIPGVKLFMGSSTGNMLVNRQEALERIFRTCKLPLMAHCEDTDIINRNMEEAKKAWGADPPVSLHAMIRSEEACLSSTRKAVELAQKYGTRLHVAHVSTAEELELFESEKGKVKSEKFASAQITAEACVGYLYFSQLDHERLGARIKVNPAIKTPVDQYLLRQALVDGRIATISTDHAPHLLQQKEGGCARAASGMPMLQFSLVTMLELVDEGVLTIQRLVELMSHQPAQLFGVERRGFLREGYQADLVVVRPHSPWTVTKNVIQSRCGWSPMEGHEYQWQVEYTLCNGHLVYQQGRVDDRYIGQEIRFNHRSE